MTIHQAIEKGLKIVRCDPWNPYCRMELPDKRVDGTHGPWGYVIDPAGNRACGVDAENKIAILLLPVPGQISADPNADEWEEWVRPEDYDAKFAVKA